MSKSQTISKGVTKPKRAPQTHARRRSLKTNPLSRPIVFPASSAELPLRQTFHGNVWLEAPVTVILPFGEAKLGPGDSTILRTDPQVKIVLATRVTPTGERIVQISEPKSLLLDTVGKASSLVMRF